MALASVNIRVDEEVKRQAETLFEELGLNLTTAVNAFFRQAVRERSMPFRLTTESSVKPKPVPGRMKGKIWMSDDFDEPLEEMKAYM